VSNEERQTHQGAQEPGEGRFLLSQPTPEPVCEYDAHKYDCADFATQFEAQQCFDSCWVATGWRVRRCGE